METFPRARRPHNKTRLGCYSCKKRRVRCDQERPECRNCIGRGFDCEFPVLKRKSKEEERGPASRAVLRTRELEEADGPDSTVTRIVLPPQPPSPYNLNLVDLQFIQHFNNQSLSLSHRMVKDSMMAFAASHIGWLTKSDDLHKKAAAYQTSAYRRLRKAIGGFSQETADAVLAATAVLTWQATEWKSWSALHQGMKAVMESMRHYASTSLFSTILLFNIRELDSCTSFSPPSPRDTQRLNLCIAHLRSAAAFINRATPLHIQLYQLLLTFALRVQATPPSLAMTPDEQYEILFPLRGWIFLMPTAVLDSEVMDVNHLVCFSFYNATVLAIRPFFSEAATLFYKVLHTEPLREIHKHFVYAEMMEIKRKEEEKEGAEREEESEAEVGGILSEVNRTSVSRS
ncbi:hypothetical protein N431DRAFT_504865 [Stipitochalara longipes BDJ]|nr:hypothetical protein N431DRAFT_504865 [Stipitochalara longipes BDJ]